MNQQQTSQVVPGTRVGLIPIHEQTVYWIDCSVQIGHIGSDTALWLRSFAENPDRSLQEAERRARSTVGDNQHFLALAETGRLLEEEYERWKGRRSEPVLSLAALQGAPYLFNEIVTTFANEMLSNNYTSMETALQQLDGRLNILALFRVLERSVARSVQDLSGMNSEQIKRLQVSLDHIDQAVRFYSIDAQIGSLEDEDYSSQARHDAKWRKIKRTTQKAIRRSAEMLSSIAGETTTRMFLTEGKITVEGENCLYEIKRGSSLAHGGAGPGKLLVLDKQNPSIVLCSMCILSPGVPMMDHVASLIMHIRAGLEEDILKAGNIGSVHKLAYGEEWLIPYLPQRETLIPFLSDNDDDTDSDVSEVGDRSLIERIKRSMRIVQAPSQAQLEQTRFEVGHWIFERTIAPWADAITMARKDRSQWPDEIAQRIPTILLPHEQGYRGSLVRPYDNFTADVPLIEQEAEQYSGFSP